MKHKPGETCTKTCKYNMCDKNGKVLNTVDVEKDQSFPPAMECDCYYEEK